MAVATATRRSRYLCMLRYALVSAFLLHPVVSRTQVAGLNNLAVLDLGSTARTAALGMDYLALFDNDLSIGIDNPSLLHSSMSHSGLLAFVPMLDGSNMGSLTFAHALKRMGTLAVGFHFVNYGRFHGYDEEENYTGDFGAADYSLTLGYGLAVSDHFSVGLNCKPVLSQYEHYKAVALLFDVAASYLSENKSLVATLMCRNTGAQLATFDGMVEHMPFELSAQLSYKLQRAPFRLFVAATELQQWDLRYADPLHPTTQTDPFTGQVTEEPAFTSFLDNLMRHTLLGVELNLGTALFARVGYSYRQSAEMRGYDAFNLSGFSFGLGIHAKRFDFAYARRNYHLAQALNYLTLSYQF